MGKMGWYDWISIVLLLVGGLNWGLIGVANFDLVAWTFEAGSSLTRTIYTLVGAAAVFSFFRLFTIKN